MKTHSNTPSQTERVHDIPCPLCHSGDSVPKWDCSGFLFHKCLKCGAYFQKSQPVHDDVVQRYDESYFQYEIENEESFFSLMEMGLKDIDFFSLEKKLKDKSIVDIGCATGRLLYFLKKRGWSVAGAEVCRSSAEYGNSQYNVSIFNGTLEEASFNDNSFSIVHCSHLIEHLADPGAFLDEVKRILKPGGFFLCTTPNSSGFQARLFKARWRSAIADHLVLFNKRNLKKQLEERGFTTGRIRTWGGLGVGFGPLWIKRIMDPLAKRTGTGDVMMFLAQLPVQID